MLIIAAVNASACRTQIPSCLIVASCGSSFENTRRSPAPSIRLTGPRRLHVRVIGVSLYLFLGLAHLAPRIRHIDVRLGLKEK